MFKVELMEKSPLQVQLYCAYFLGLILCLIGMSLLNTAPRVFKSSYKFLSPLRWSTWVLKQGSVASLQKAVEACAQCKLIAIGGIRWRPYNPKGKGQNLAFALWIFLNVRGALLNRVIETSKKQQLAACSYVLSHGANLRHSYTFLLKLFLRLAEGHPY